MRPCMLFDGQNLFKFNFFEETPDQIHYCFQRSDSPFVYLLPRSSKESKVAKDTALLLVTSGLRTVLHRTEQPRACVYFRVD